MFGEFIRNRRLELGLSLRAFCKTHGEDPSNWSKLERGILPPPEDYARINQIADYLAFDHDSSERTNFLDLAAAESGRLPEDLASNKKLLDSLPIVFRTLRSETPTEDDLLKLADLIRKDRDPN